MRKADMDIHGPTLTRRTWQAASDRHQNMTRAVEIYERILAPIDGRDPFARVSTICAINDGLQNLDHAAPALLCRSLTVRHSA